MKDSRFINDTMKNVLVAVVVLAASVVSAATRPTAVAGSFYTDDPQQLRTQIEEMMADGEFRGGARAVVVPHAGYAFSGAVAGRVFASLDGGKMRRVVLLGPSHHSSFAGGALPARNLAAFETPLGDVPLDLEAVRALRKHRDFRGPASAHEPEHSLEVEIPFLQVLAPTVQIVPILVGQQTDLETARRMAEALLPLLDAGTVVVVSSDFTHHGERYGWTPFSEPGLGAKLLRLGRATADRLAAADPVGFTHQVEVSGDTVCGLKPSMVLAELLAHAFRGRGEVLDVTTSGHLTGRWDLSVTYAGISYHGAWIPWGEPETPVLGEVATAQGRQIVSLARAALTSFLIHDESLARWYSAPHDANPGRALAGAFVTLNQRGKKPGSPDRLRACMGVIEADQPLDEAVVTAAVWAAQDPRFPPLEAAELDSIAVEVSILSPRHLVARPEDIEVGTHGVVLSKGRHRALFLPQVATEQGWDRETMLDHLAQKAGIEPGGWRSGTRFEVFTAQVFGEEH